MNRPDPPDTPRTSKDDQLLRRYHEASALNGAQPAPGLRAAVLAEARTQAARARPAANDAQWRWRALGSLAVLGLVGLLVLQFDRASDTEHETALGRNGTDQAAPPALRTPEPPPARVTPSDGAATAPAAAQTQRSAAPPTRAPTRAPAPAPAPVPDPLPERLAPPRAAGAAAEPAAQADTAPGPPQAQTNTAAGNTRAQTKALSDNAPVAGATASAPRPAAPASATPPTTPSALQSISTADRALLRAAAQGSAEDARAALAQGAQINATQEQGRSALMLAAIRGDAALVRSLLDAGADASRTDRDGQTAADLADHAGHHAIATGLRSIPPR